MMTPHNVCVKAQVFCLSVRVTLVKKFTCIIVVLVGGIEQSTYAVLMFSF